MFFRTYMSEGIQINNKEPGFKNNRDNKLGKCRSANNKRESESLLEFEIITTQNSRGFFSLS